MALVCFLFQEIVNKLSEIGFDEGVEGLMLLGTLTDSWEGLKYRYRTQRHKMVLFLWHWLKVVFLVL